MVGRNAEPALDCLNRLLLRVRQNVKLCEVEIDMRVSRLVRERLETDVEAFFEPPGVSQREALISEHASSNRCLLFCQTLAVLGQKIAGLNITFQFQRLPPLPE